MSHRSKKNRFAQGVADLEEVQPGRFRVHTMQICALLKGEGDIQGDRFTLTTWRRDGLLARLRMRGFKVFTLEDRVQALPGLPVVEPIGPAEWRVVGGMDRYSFFDPDGLDWVAIDEQDREGVRSVLLHVGWIVRRRHGRGPSSYHQVLPAKRGTGLLPLTETDALLAGYALAAQAGPCWLPVRREDGKVCVPALVLPLPHRDVLQRLGTPTKSKWQFNDQVWDIVMQVYARLGVRV